MARPITKTIVNTYRPIERHWFRFLDAVQYRWFRFARSDGGRFLVTTTKWSMLALFVVLKITFKIMKWFLIATFVIGTTVMFVGFGFALSKKGR